MTQSATSSPHPRLQSALQDLLSMYPVPQGQPAHAHHLALQIAHNLRFQHAWRELRLHYKSSNQALPRPVLSGLPPQRLYVHPDEQIELLQQQKAEGKTGLPILEAEREWVMPSELRERWSLKRFGQVFDVLPTVPADTEGGPLFADMETALQGGMVARANTQGALLPIRRREVNRVDDEGVPNPWRMTNPKRMLLATVDDDSTVVYYVIHDGIVKPRQN